MRCPYCRESSVSWLHGTVMVIFAAAALFFLLKTF
jgi:hypothetical protein